MPGDPRATAAKAIGGRQPADVESTDADESRSSSTEGSQRPLVQKWILNGGKRLSSMVLGQSAKYSGPGKAQQQQQSADGGRAHKDALLSGPLMGSCLDLNGPGEPFEPEGNGSIEDVDEDEAVSRFGILEEAPSTSGAGEPQQFRACFMRVLRPDVGNVNPETSRRSQSHQVTCMQASSCGRLLIAAGKVTASLTEDDQALSPSRSVPAIARGWYAVWERDQWGFWTQWDVDGILEFSVSAMAILGSAMVLGHVESSESSTPMSGDQDLQAFSDISLWHIDRRTQTVSREKVVETQGMRDRSRQLFASSSDTRRLGSTVSNISVAEEGYRLGVTSVQWLCETRSSSQDAPPEGAVLTTVTKSGTVCLWTFQNPRLGSSVTTAQLVQLEQNLLPIQEDTEERREIHDMDFLSRVESEDGDMLLAAASAAGVATLWKVQPDDGNASKSRLEFWKNLKHPREVNAVSFRQSLGTGTVGDADLLLTACMDYSLRLWDIDNAVCTRRIQNNTSHFNRCIFSYHGNMILAGCLDGSLLTFDTYSGMRMKSISGHQEMVTDMALVPGHDGVLATSSDDGTLRLWEMKSNAHGVVYGGDSNLALSTVYNIAFARGSSLVVSTHRDGTLRVARAWDGKPASERTKSILTHSKLIFGLAVHPVQQIVATASHDTRVSVWDLETGVCLWSHSQMQQGKDREFSSVAFSPDGHWLLAGSFNKRITLFTRQPTSDPADADPAGWEVSCTWRNHSKRVWAVQFSDCGLWMASGAWDGTVHIYAVEDVRATLKRPQAQQPASTPFSSLDCSENVWSVEFRPTAHSKQSEPAMVATGSADSAIRIWRHDGEALAPVSSWEMVGQLRGHDNTVTGLAWRPDGEMLVSSSFDKTIRLWARHKGLFGPCGVFGATATPAMAIQWAHQNPEDPEGSGTVIAVGTMKGLVITSDATDAGQPFVPFSRAQEVLRHGSIKQINSMFARFPETLTTLGPDSSGMLMLWGIVRNAHSKTLLPFLLETAVRNGISPLLPYGPENHAILSYTDFRLVSAVVDAAVTMHESGDRMSSLLLSTGYGTLSILQLIKTFPDQAVVLLNHFGMLAADEAIYGPSWNPHQKLLDGVFTYLSTDKKVTETRNPEALWDNQEHTWIGLDSTMEQTVAACASLPYITGIPPDEWHNHSGTFRAASGEAPTFSRLSDTFLHLAFHSQNPLLFDTSLGRSIIQWKWFAYGRLVYSIQLTFFVAQLWVITLQAFAWGAAYRAPECAIGLLDPSETCAYEPAGVTPSLAILLLVAMQLVFEVFRASRVWSSYFGFWHCFEWVLMPLLLFSGVAGVLASPTIPVDGSSLANWAISYLPITTSLAALLSWVKILYFMRAFSGTGGLVRLMIEITHEMRYMIVLVLIGIVGCMVAFYVLPPYIYFNSPDLVGSLDNVMDMLFFTFSMMVASYDSTSITNWLSQFITMVFLFFQAILVLNALIALMSDSTEKIKGKIGVIALRERAGLLMEMELVFGSHFLHSHHYRPRWLHALVADDQFDTPEGTSNVKLSGTDGGGGGGGGGGDPLDDTRALYVQILSAVKALQAEQRQLAARMEEGMAPGLGSTEAATLQPMASVTMQRQQSLLPATPRAPVRTMSLAPIPSVSSDQEGEEAEEEAREEGPRAAAWWNNLRVSVHAGRDVGSSTDDQPAVRKIRTRFRK